jgi:hypothetical protein
MSGTYVSGRQEISATIAGAVQRHLPTGASRSEHEMPVQCDERVQYAEGLSVMLRGVLSWGNTWGFVVRVAFF